MDLIKTREKPLRRPRNLFYLVMALLAVVGLTYVVLSVAPASRASPVEPAPEGSLARSTTGDMYLLAHRADGLNSLLRLNTGTGQVEPIYETYPGSVMARTGDGRSVYVYDQSRPVPQGSLVRVNSQDGPTGWEVKVAWFPFVGPPDQGLWLSSDEKRIYLLGAQADDYHLNIYSVDTAAGALAGEFNLELPYSIRVVSSYPRLWKIPWAEAVVVASGDQLFTFDLLSGNSGTPVTIFSPEDLKRVPRNMSLGLYVTDGDWGRQSQRLYLATSSQEILSVDFTSEPYTVDTVFSLPPGWQFAGWGHLLVDASQAVAYVQVKRDDSPVNAGLEVDEILQLEMAQWTQVAAFNLREHTTSPEDYNGQLEPGRAAGPQGFGLALSPDGQQVFALMQRGTLSFSRDQGARDQGRFTRIHWGDIPEPLWYSVVP
jgi:hypothetical protein